jgi:hypothetical protein
MGPGATFAERFEIVALAGDGGTGHVYRARDRVTGEARWNDLSSGGKRD